MKIKRMWGIIWITPMIVMAAIFCAIVLAIHWITGYKIPKEGK